MNGKPDLGFRTGAGLCAALFIAGSVPAEPATHYVTVNGTGPAPFSSWENAAGSIQDAVDAAGPDATILVSNGVYSTGGQSTYRVYVNQKKGLALRAVSPHPDETVIAGAPDGTSGSFGSGATACLVIRFSTNVTISGFTFSNGHTAVGGDGGGLYQRNSLGTQVTNCVFVNCRAARNGGGAGRYPDGLAPTNFWFSRCVFRENRAGDTSDTAGNGAGAQSALLTDCLLEGNQATNYGGGAYDCVLRDCGIRGNGALNAGGGLFSCGASGCQVLSNQIVSTAAYGYGGGGAASCPALSNCVFLGNSAYYGGAVGLPSDGRLVNCLVAGNEAYQAGALFIDANSPRTGIQVIHCTIASNRTTYGSALRSKSTGSSWDFLNTIVWDNRTAAGATDNWGDTSQNIRFENSCTTPCPTGAKDAGGNLDEDPRLIQPPANCRLPGASPCINRGRRLDWMDAARDLDGLPRVDRWSGLVDMGCYEYQEQGTFLLVR